MLWGRREEGVGWKIAGRCVKAKVQGLIARGCCWLHWKSSGCIWARRHSEAEVGVRKEAI